MKKNYFTKYSTHLRFCLLLPLLASSLIAFTQVTKTVGAAAGQTTRRWEVRLTLDASQRSGAQEVLFADEA